MFAHLTANCSSGFQKHRKCLLSSTITRFLGVFFITIFIASVLHAQNSQTETILGFSGKPLSCDDSVAFHDLIVTEALTKLKENSVLFVVVSQGTGENSDELIQRRLYNIHQYFRDRGNRLSREKIIIVVGQSVSGNGRIEYYINGQLYLRLLYPKNGYICHSCCGPDIDYYPDKGIYENQQKQKQKGKKRG